MVKCRSSISASRSSHEGRLTFHPPLSWRTVLRKQPGAVPAPGCHTSSRAWQPRNSSAKLLCFMPPFGEGDFATTRRLASADRLTAGGCGALISRGSRGVRPVRTGVRGATTRPHADQNREIGGVAVAEPTLQKNDLVNNFASVGPPRPYTVSGPKQLVAPEGGSRCLPSVRLLVFYQGDIDGHLGAIKRLA